MTIYVDSMKGHRLRDYFTNKNGEKILYTKEVQLERIKKAIQALIDDPSPRSNTTNIAKQIGASYGQVRREWHQYKAWNRELTTQQEGILCGRLDRLTRFGGQAKAVEEPCTAECLVEKYACGILHQTEDLDHLAKYSMKSGWSKSFLG